MRGAGCARVGEVRSGYGAEIALGQIHTARCNTEYESQTLVLGTRK
jgi:hypothetical protein